MPSTTPVITRPQNTNIIAIIPSPQAPHTHDIGCMPQLQSGLCASAHVGTNPIATLTSPTSARPMGLRHRLATLPTLSVVAPMSKRFVMAELRPLARASPDALRRDRPAG